jgi:signal transduction histidine kinase
VATRRQNGTFRVWLLSAAIALAAAAVLPLVSHDRPALPGGPAIPWWLLAVAFGLAEVFVMHLRIARHAHSFTLGELPLVVGLALATPVQIVLAQAVGLAVVLAWHRRQKPIRLAFNIAQRTLWAVLAVAVFAGVRDIAGGGWVGIWVGAFAAMLLADLVAAVLINAAISLSEGKWMLFDQVVGIGTMLTVANTALGLVAVMLIREQAAAIVLVALPAATTFLAGKAYTDVQRKHDDVLLLERSTRLAQGSLKLEEMLPPLLEHVREMFRSEIAEILLWPVDDRQPPVASRVGPDEDRAVMTETRLDPRQGVWARIVAEREAILLERPIRNPNLARFFGAQGIVDAVVAPIQSDDELLGTLMVANRIGDFSTFDEEDLKLVETVANHVAVAIRNTQLVRTLEGALAHETEINRLKDDFLATVSHELRTPLTTVKGYLRTLLAPEIELSNADRRDFLQRADRSADRLQSMIEDLLFASRVEASPRAVANDVVSVHELIDRIVDERAATLGEPGRLEVVTKRGRWVLRTDEEQVSRVISNLVDNALKHSTATVTISAEQDDGGVRISVEDRGRGIPLEEQGKIFDRFYQVDQSLTRLVGGAGIGLYICRKAAESLGGRVWLERSDATGSLFCLWVPFDASAAAEDREGHDPVVLVDA